MQATRGLRERPSYEKLMAVLRADYPLHLPNRDAYFLRNSIYMTQFDGVGMLDNVEEQQDNLLEQQIRESVIKQHIHKYQGMDSKFSKLFDPSFGLPPPPPGQPPQPPQAPRYYPYTSPFAAADSFSTGYDPSTWGPSQPPQPPPASPQQGQPETEDDGLAWFDIADDNDMPEHEQQIDAELARRKQAEEDKRSATKKAIKDALDKHKTTPEELLKKLERFKKKSQDKRDANDDTDVPDSTKRATDEGGEDAKRRQRRKLRKKSS